MSQIRSGPAAPEKSSARASRRLPSSFHSSIRSQVLELSSKGADGHLSLPPLAGLGILAHCSAVHWHSYATHNYSTVALSSHSFSFPHWQLCTVSSSRVPLLRGSPRRPLSVDHEGSSTFRSGSRAHVLLGTTCDRGTGAREIGRKSGREALCQAGSPGEIGCDEPRLVAVASSEGRGVGALGARTWSERREGRRRRKLECLFGWAATRASEAKVGRGLQRSSRLRRRRCT